jgi:RHS repeat-associated protein
MQQVCPESLRPLRRIATVTLILFLPIACVVVSRLDAFANREAAPQVNAVQPDFGYTGLFYHQRSGLSFAKARAYDSGLKRWLNRDPNAQNDQTNVYDYVGNAPFEFVDLRGNDRTLPPVGPQPPPKQPTGGLRNPLWDLPPGGFRKPDPKKRPRCKWPDSAPRPDPEDA